VCCEKIDCVYYSKSTKTCDYRLHTGVGRGTTIEDCDKYSDVVREKSFVKRNDIAIDVGPPYPREIPYNLSRAARSIPFSTLHKKREESITMDLERGHASSTIDAFESTLADAAARASVNVEFVPPKKERPPMPQDSKKKKLWWDSVVTELDKGRSPNEVAEEFGTTVRQINITRGRRQSTERKRAAKQVNSQEPEQTPLESVATAATEPIKDKARIKAIDSDTLTRVMNIANSIWSDDSRFVKASALKLMNDLMVQACFWTNLEKIEIRAEYSKLEAAERSE